MKRRQLARGLLAAGGICVVLSAGFVGADVLTAYLVRALHWQIPETVLAVINPWLVLICGGLVAAVVSTRGGMREPFGPIREALGRIARGDFAIRLDEDQENPLRELAATVNHMAAELGQMESLRQEFISNVSHEIQSPLTSIRGFAQALRSDDLTSEQRSAYLGIIEAESTRLSRLSDNLLMLTTLETAEGALATTTYRLDKQIREVVLSCEPAWQAKEIEWDLRLGKVTVAGHEELLSQVWINLLQNAIKFSHPGGRIEVDLEQQADQVLVRITDHGIGIAPEDQRRIFERFYKADKARDRSMGGSGLGLAIARKIVNLHGGSITAASQLGAGATFTVILPVRSEAVYTPFTLCVYPDQDVSATAEMNPEEVSAHDSGHCPRKPAT